MISQFRRALRALWVAAHLLLGLLLCMSALAPLRRLDPARARSVRSRLVRWWMRRLISRINVRVCTDGAPTAGPALLVANHVSWLDIPCLLQGQDMRFVAKQELAHWPVVGALAACSGTIFIARGHGADQALHEMGAALDAGHQVLVFPEGTSTDGTDVKRFHARLFEAAIAARVPVQPIAICYPIEDRLHSLVPFVRDDRFVPHLWRILGERAITAVIHFGPLIPPGPARGDLAGQAHAWVRRHIVQTPVIQSSSLHPENDPLNTSA